MRAGFHPETGTDLSQETTSRPFAAATCDLCQETHHGVHRGAERHCQKGGSSRNEEDRSGVNTTRP